eukprot:m.138084 g.138084  ORF g.138084 m.138084 type:complete len:191 (+) comp17017_c1_seq2:97-669(+)
MADAERSDLPFGHGHRAAQAAAAAGGGSDLPFGHGHRQRAESERGRGGGGGGGRPLRPGEREAPDLYGIYKGKVRNVLQFGGFVEMEGIRKQGLVHVSQLSNHRVEDANSVLATGDTVYVKCISLGEEDGSGKVSLTIKSVNQSTGHDEDPTHIQVRCTRLFFCVLSRSTFDAWSCKQTTRHNKKTITRH